MKSGIYVIRNICSNKVYIGQSVDVKRRIREHKRLLLKGEHNNDYLQKNFNKYGTECFEFDVIEYCSLEKLDERERYWISEYQSMNRECGFNLESGGNEGKVFSEDRIARITGEGNPMYGKKHSQEFVKKITLLNRGSSDKLNENDVEYIKVKTLEGVPSCELEKKFNVKKSTISKIVRCKNWAWVREDLNEKLLTFRLENKKKRTEEERLKKERLAREKKERKKRNEKIINDFKKGIHRDEIIKKYNISKTTYVRIISPVFNEQRKETIQLVHKLKKEGLMNKEIAEKLNIHRTTVTEYLKMEPE